jgi:hypothetical protein
MTSEDWSFHPDRLTLVTDISSARWVEEGLGWQFAHLTALMPRGFASYARLFHPAQNRDGEPVRWADIASWSGRKAHPLMAFERISSPRHGYGVGLPPWSDNPIKGSLEYDDAIVLAEFLADFTDTGEKCYFAVWDGYGQFSPGARSTITTSGGQPQFPPPEVLTAPRLAGVGRDYVLYLGPLSVIGSFFHGLWDKSPNIWWPEDRAWCFSTDIDLDSTYIGGSERCIEALTGDPRFEVLKTTLDAPVYMAADTLNSDD